MKEKTGFCSMLFEAGSRYVFVLVPFTCILAVIGVKSLAERMAGKHRCA